MTAKSMGSSFQFRGTIPASKSILNRLLIIRSYEPLLEIRGDSNADDVQKMKGALRSLELGDVADCGAAGTTLRFLALKAARNPGRHILKGTPRLFARPQGELIQVIEQLGCRVEMASDRMIIEGEGWKVPSDGLEVPRGVSSQFASAVVLNAWSLDQPLRMHFSGDRVSESYFAMTLEIVRRAGLNWQREKDDLVLPAGARIQVSGFECEIDVSSAFAVAALAVASGGRAEIENWPGQESLQPDSVFPEILLEMGCDVSIRDRVLTVSRLKDQVLRPIRRDLREMPDLFPVLGVLCALADGSSALTGAPHLAHKESSRISKTAELLRLMGAEVIERPDGMEIRGGRSFPSERCTFDPDHDHRLAMAAAVARSAGVDVEILHRDVVNKSFPDFWSIAEGEI